MAAACYCGTPWTFLLTFFRACFVFHSTDEFEKRRKMRQRRNRDEKRRARQIEEEERKRLGIPKGTTIIRSQFNQLQTSPSVPMLSAQVDDTSRSDTSSPSLDTPVGSPLSHSISAPDFHPIGASPTDDGQTAFVSFAQVSSPSLDTPVGNPLSQCISAPNVHPVWVSPTDDG